MFINIQKNNNEQRRFFHIHKKIELSYL